MLGKTISDSKLLTYPDEKCEARTSEHCKVEGDDRELVLVLTVLVMSYRSTTAQQYSVLIEVVLQSVLQTLKTLPV
jgi:hypothetical protein